MRAFLAVTALFTLTACGMNMGQIKAADKAAKKDCAACEKMCSVAGDAEKNPGAVDKCKADCKKSCTP